MPERFSQMFDVRCLIFNCNPSPQLYLGCLPQRSTATLAALPAMSRFPTAPFSPFDKGRGGICGLMRDETTHDAHGFPLLLERGEDEGEGSIVTKSVAERDIDVPR